jgi:hypothetical protein
LPFEAHAQFRKAGLDDWAALNGQLAEYFWNPAWFERRQPQLWRE